MILNFDQIDVSVNNSGILSTNSSINTSNSIEAAYILGYSRPINQIPQGPVKSTFNSTYFPVIGQEPNYTIVNKIKSMVNDSIYSGEMIVFAGLSGHNWFLDNYGFKVQPNNIVESNISYSLFDQLQGGITKKTNTINYLDGGSLAHSWTTYILDSENYQTTSIYEFNYDFKVNWQPIYVIGQKTPIEVKLLSAVETISFNMDDFRNVLFTGENVYNHILTGNNGNLQFRNLAVMCQDECESTGDSQSLTLDISGFRVKSISPTAQIAEFLRINYIANKYY